MLGPGDRGSGPPAAPWSLPPAVVTALFVVGHLITRLDGAAPAPVAAASTDPGRGPPLSVRVVASIPPVDAAPRRAVPAPADEAALLDLLRRDGSVQFSSDEAEVIATPSHRFGADEVEIIQAEAQRRPGRLAGR